MSWLVRLCLHLQETKQRKGFRQHFTDCVGTGCHALNSSCYVTVISSYWQITTTFFKIPFWFIVFFRFLTIPQLLDASTLIKMRNTEAWLSFIGWCSNSCSNLNITTTKELAVDLQRSRKSPVPVTILEEDVGAVDSQRYLRVHINNKLDRPKK